MGNSPYPIKIVDFGTKKSSVVLQASHFEFYNSLQKNNIIAHIYRAFIQQKISAYKTGAFKEKFTRKEFDDLGSGKTTMRIPNPNNPDDIYDLIDTVVTLNRNPWTALGLHFIKGQNTCIMIIEGSVKAYFKLDEINRILTPEQNAFIAFVQQQGIYLITDELLGGLGTITFKKVSQSLYEIGTTGKGTAYTMPTLSESFSKRDAQYRGQRRFNIQTQNPDNIDDPYDLIDTVITYEFDPATIEHIKVYHTWQGDEKGNYNVSLHACAPMFHHLLNGKKLLPQNLFVIADIDIGKNTDAVTNTYLKHFFTTCIRNSGNEKTNTDNPFQNIETWE